MDKLNSIYGESIKIGTADIVLYCILSVCVCLLCRGRNKDCYSYAYHENRFRLDLFWLILERTQNYSVPRPTAILESRKILLDILFAVRSLITTTISCRRWTRQTGCLNCIVIAINWPSSSVDRCKYCQLSSTDDATVASLSHRASTFVELSWHVATIDGPWRNFMSPDEGCDRHRAMASTVLPDHRAGKQI